MYNHLVMFVLFHYGIYDNINDGKSFVLHDITEFELVKVDACSHVRNKFNELQLFI